ncbi:hypothetical protein CYLTODRAFT_403801 [Cylindrobasidium torrendii FP15055 ss-10]|uniref:RRM domain-containing protein n=1 Tax=Cylindrobasidium torrendii FP15055 ss-10 TaxID=1314674 RepID=A0A0D7B0H6_9AGAR|nr:hypothetical protein CYLTODRAFT_403801 [Cylindrobasidium torrendii FP15055 ss-10]
MSDAQKLTKKQKKALLFRASKGKSARKDELDDTSAAPDMVVDAPLEDTDGLDRAKGQAKEDADGQEDAMDVDQKKVVVADHKGKGRAKDSGVDTGKAVASKKRKREEGDDGAAAVALVDGEVEPKKKRKTNSDKQRFILFVGNLKYTTSLDLINTHFAACDPPPSVRLLTPKTTNGRPSTKSKGCAFLEFENKASLQTALNLHHSQLDGRMINVELTAGGGGKSDARLQKVKERNKELQTQRNKKIEKKAKHGEKPSIDNSQPVRYSATSGADVVPQTEKTWTVEDNMDGQKTHRGGKKHADKTRGKKKKAFSKEWGTGVNAIPVG